MPCCTHRLRGPLLRTQAIDASGNYSIKAVLTGSLNFSDGTAYNTGEAPCTARATRGRHRFCDAVETISVDWPSGAVARPTVDGQRQHPACGALSVFCLSVSGKIPHAELHARELCLSSASPHTEVHSRELYLSSVCPHAELHARELCLTSVCPHAELHTRELCLSSVCLRAQLHARELCLSSVVRVQSCMQESSVCLLFVCMRSCRQGSSVCLLFVRVRSCTLKVRGPQESSVFLSVHPSTHLLASPCVDVWFPLALGLSVGF
jgi:hypothetical protein